MADIAGNSSTTTSVVVGGSISSSIETVGDRDWIRFSAVEGQGYSVQMFGGWSNLDLALYDSSSELVSYDNDGVNGREDLFFEATYSGDYYIEVKGYQSEIGDYSLNVDQISLIPTFTYQQIADYLTDGFWNDVGAARHAFAGTSLTYNISALTAAGKALAQAAFQQWSVVTGLVFTLTTGVAKIMLDDADEGAYASYSASGSTTIGSDVNVGLDWLADYGTDINGYSFQTYLHEIGHALGLGHAGNYNGTGGWSANGNGDNHFLNDSWQATVMSYFDQSENASVNATFAYVVGPMIADILAMQSLYGVQAVNVGNTIWGFGSNAGSVFDFASYTQGSMVAYAINDRDGTDTLDASGFSADQVLDLREGMYSDIGGEIGNIGIAYGAVIENAIGGSGADRLIGNTAANVLNGHAGADTMEGGAGDDTYYVDNAGDTVVETTGNGSDRVYSSVTFAIGAQEIERLTLTGGANINATGGAGANTLDGNSGNNTLDGGAGADRMYGGAGDDTYYVDNAGDLVIETVGNGSDRVFSSVTYSINGHDVEQLTLTGTANINAAGSADDNILIGNTGNNFLNGRGGADQMSGGAGDDTYSVDNAGDQVVENAGGGTDRVNATVSFAIGTQEIERVSLMGTASINATGGAGDEMLVGNSGNNVLDGGQGVDRMYGAAGDDTFYIDNALDRVFETSGNGFDQVFSSTTCTVYGQYVEVITLTGTDNIGAVGSSISNTIYGNSGNNTINALAGADAMYGGAGTDTYYVDHANDAVYEVAGEGAADRVLSSVSYSLVGRHVERLNLLDRPSGTNNLNATGNELDNFVGGNSGNNIINGGEGFDVLTGGAGADYFVFNTALSAANADRINDFTSVDDTIRLDNAVMTALGGTGVLSAAMFWQSTAGVAHDADDRIIYDSDGGQLYYDADGNGAGARVLIATLLGAPSVALSDFVVI